MKRFTMFALIAGLFVVVGLVATTGIVLAQRPVTPGTQPGFGPGGMMGGQGGFGGMMDSAYAGQGVMQTYMQQAIADKLGMSVADYQAALNGGETFWQIAESKGFSVEQAQQMMIDARSAAFDKAVSDGVISQDQAGWMQQRMNQNQMDPEDCPGAGYNGTNSGTGYGPGRGRGMMGGRWNTSNTGTNGANQ